MKQQQQKNIDKKTRPKDLIEIIKLGKRLKIYKIRK